MVRDAGPSRRIRSKSRSRSRPKYEPRMNVFVGPKRIVTTEDDSSQYDKLFTKPAKPKAHNQQKQKQLQDGAKGNAGNASNMKRPAASGYVPKGQQLKLEHFAKQQSPKKRKT